MFLFAVSFIAGLLTVLAPCVLPLLPVIVGGSVAEGGNRRRAYTICAALGVSVVLFTLLLKVSSLFINVPPSTWQYVSGAILIGFGLTMLFPRLWDGLGFVNTLNMSSNRALAAGYRRNSAWGDVLMGASLGPVFASCSPTYFIILATVLPASFAMGLLDLFAYAVGLSGFLLLIALTGQRLVDRLGVAIEPGGWFRRGIGTLFVIVGLAVLTGIEAKTEAWLLNRGFDATRIEQRLLGASGGASAYATSTEFLLPAQKAGRYQKAPELVAPDGYINTGGKPITLAGLRGKVVLLDIWTYSCINCQRTLPYVKAWYEKYAPEGLEIIGVHTPEFAFEKVPKNVQEAVTGFGIAYPVILDNQYQTWNAYGNQFWPRKYLIDMDGYIVYDHAGEGNYAETEAAIQWALRERASRLGTEMPDAADAAEPQGAIDAETLRVGSPETYFGAARNSYLANGQEGKAGVQMLALPKTFYKNALYLGGTWSLEEEYAESRSATEVRFLYDAKDVYFVASAKQPIKIRVTRDGGTPLGADRGADVDADGYATIHADRLYKLIEGAAAGAHTIEISIPAAGLKAYTFTFG